MRIVSWNILNGGLGRADPLAEVIEAQRADMVALIEADDADVVDRIARRLGMDYIRAEGREHAVCLMSRWPIMETINHAAGRADARCLLETKVRQPAGREWTIGVAHFAPGAREEDEAGRETELADVLRVFAPHRQAGRAHVLCGDFNSNSPLQMIDPEKVKAKTRKAWEENGGTIPRRVVQALLDAGYVDTLAAADAQNAPTAASFTTQHPGQRVDYIFAHNIAPASIKKAWVEQDRLAKYASDHFPIAAELP